VKALVVSNMLPDAAHPERGRFVRDQVAALRRLAAEGAGNGPDAGPDAGPNAEPGAGPDAGPDAEPNAEPGAGPDAGREARETLEVELYEFPPGIQALAAAAKELRRRYGPHGDPAQRPDVVHAHFGLSAWPALAVPARARGLTVHGTDLRVRRTRAATAAVLKAMDLIAAPTAELARELPGRAARERAKVIPCGVDTERFRPIPRAAARAELGLDPDPNRPRLLFPADPTRRGKRFDRARALAETLKVPLDTLGGVPPEEVPLWVNAANAVIVTSEAEGFGLAALEALACDVPVAATPTGVHRQALEGVEGTLCAPFDLDRWRAAVEPHLRGQDPRIEGRAKAEEFSAARMAERLAQAWRALLERDAGRDR
jgi:teichuronic acid biosynthesis glycosyltransferase TuaC